MSVNNEVNERVLVCMHVSMCEFKRTWKLMYDKEFKNLYTKTKKCFTQYTHLITYKKKKEKVGVG